jgi:hypothetical protein
MFQRSPITPTVADKCRCKLLILRAEGRMLRVSKASAWLDERFFPRSVGFWLPGRNVRDGANKKMGNQRRAADDRDGAGAN